MELQTLLIDSMVLISIILLAIAPLAVRRWQGRHLKQPTL